MKQWFAIFINDLKFLGAECKREFSDLEITPMTAEQRRRRRDEMERLSISGKLRRGVLKIRDGKMTFCGMSRDR